MRTGAVIAVLWLLVGLFAAYQRGYFAGDDQTNCAEVSTVLVTVVAGPLNYVGVNPTIECGLPQPSQ